MIGFGDNAEISLDSLVLILDFDDEVLNPWD